MAHDKKDNHDSTDDEEGYSSAAFVKNPPLLGQTFEASEFGLKGRFSTARTCHFVVLVVVSAFVFFMRHSYFTCRN